MTHHVGKSIQFVMLLCTHARKKDCPRRLAMRGTDEKKRGRHKFVALNPPLKVNACSPIHLQYLCTNPQFALFLDPVSAISYYANANEMQEELLFNYKQGPKPKNVAIESKRPLVFTLLFHGDKEHMEKVSSGLLTLFETAFTMIQDLREGTFCNLQFTRTFDHVCV